jgi:hypothetical protein
MFETLSCHHGVPGSQRLKETRLMVCPKVSGFALALLIGTAFSGSADGQGLIFNLPADGMAVEYEGTLTQGASADDPAPLSWTCELSIKSVGQENADFQGTMQACRWIEIKTVTGKAGAAGIDPGPVGARIYKVLIPESKVVDDWKDAEGIPNDMMPIVRGFRRLGEEAVKPISTPALRYYPTISLLTSYKDPETIATSEIPETLLQGESITARRMKGKLVMESTKSRSVNEGEYWVSKDVPFGLARWVVTVTTLEKDSAAPVSEFKPVIVKKVDMKLRRVRENAESELVTE